MALACVGDPEKVKVIVSFLTGEDTRLARTAAEVLRLMSDRDKSVAQPHIDELIETLAKPNHDAIKRSIFRLFQFLKFNDDQAGLVVELAFEHLQDRGNPIAVRVFAMTTVYNITKVYPELYDELVAVISTNLSEESTGFQNRAMKIINRKWK